MSQVIRDSSGVARCSCCNRAYNPWWAYLDDEEADGEYTVKLCESCFEDGVEQYEERRRERIARNNEY